MVWEERPYYEAGMVESPSRLGDSSKSSQKLKYSEKSIKLDETNDIFEVNIKTAYKFVFLKTNFSLKEFKFLNYFLTPDNFPPGCRPPPPSRRPLIRPLLPVEVVRCNST